MHRILLLGVFIISNVASCSKHLAGNNTEKDGLVGTSNSLRRQAVEDGNHIVGKVDVLVGESKKEEKSENEKDLLNSNISGLYI